MENCIELLRKEKGLSQENLAKMLKVSRQTIISIEKNKYSPSLDLAFQISYLFDLSIEKIFNGRRDLIDNEQIK